MHTLKRLPSPKLLVLAALGAVVLSGCTTVPAYQQQFVSKTGMTFEDSLVDSQEPTLQAQLEPGVDSSGGAQASGCSACR